MDGSPRRHTDDPKAHEKMLNITNYHRNANQNYNEVQSPMGQNKCKVAQSCLIFCDPMDCSLPGSCLWNSPDKNTGVGCHSLCVLSWFSHVWLFMTLWTVALQAPLSMRFSRQEYWSGLPFLSPGDLPDPRKIIRKSIDNQYWRRSEEKGTFLHCCWECKLVKPLWRTA